MKMRKVSKSHKHKQFILDYIYIYSIFIFYIFFDRTFKEWE